MIVNGVNLFARHLDALREVTTRGRTIVSFETYALLVAARAVRDLATGVSMVEILPFDLTDQGRKLAAVRDRVCAKRAQRSRATRAARAETLRSLGLTRTRSGAWE